MQFCPRFVCPVNSFFFLSVPEAVAKTLKHFYDAESKGFLNVESYEHMLNVLAVSCFLLLLLFSVSLFTFFFRDRDRTWIQRGASSRM